MAAYLLITSSTPGNGHRAVGRLARAVAAVGASAGLLGLPGCTVGPDYRGPPVAAPLAASAPAFRRATVETKAAPPPARWWDDLHDPVLTGLIDRGLRNSPTLRAAEARIREARAQLNSQRAAAYPSVTSTAAAIRANLSPGSPLAAIGGSGSSGGQSSGTGAGGAGSTPASRQNLSLFTAGFDALWELDLFGGVRRSVEGARANVDAAAARYEDSQVQLAAEIGQAYATLRNQQIQVALAKRNEAAQLQVLELTQARSRFGTADASNIETLRSQLIQTRAGAAPIPQQVAQSLDQLALLTGQEPGTLDDELGKPDAPVSMPTLPASVPIGNPAAMLRRRPDVRAAERTLASSNAAIGTAVAQRFPSVTLFGNIGFTNGQISDLFQKNSLSVFGGPILRWNFLNFGSVQAGIDQARAADDEAIANYDSAVLQALQDAESSLSRFGQQRQVLAQRINAVDSADRTLKLAETRHAGGTASMIDVLQARSQRVQAEQAQVTAQGDLLRDYVSLQKSLGLGWQPLPPEASAAPG